MDKAQTLEEVLVDAEFLLVETQDRGTQACRVAVAKVTQGYPTSGIWEPHQVDLQQTRLTKEVLGIPKPQASIRTLVPMHQ